ncbi:hypothetical protein BV25DRAFT_1651821 [Artomyces pyxidatus]|uniref:Uncharacterized protein n=1 Tax=Artomyces pyxidatus TaxID=48021 RepID=A0ACB8SJ59_9AGAM|nr:hypothetical protein BV25DRAFT_1651821 [Artomyces pyxidatus]
MFPPPALMQAKRELLQHVTDYSSSSSSDDDSSPERGFMRSHDTLRPSPHARAQSQGKPPKPAAPALTRVRGRDLLSHASQYVVLDESLQPVLAPRRATTLELYPRAPSASTLTLSSGSWSDGTDPTSVSAESAPAASHARAVAQLMNRLPNRQLDFDIKSLNLHLSTRVTEILACAESMWEWVLSFQEEQRWTKVQWEGAEAPPEPEGPAKELVGMSRAEFDVLLLRFELWVSSLRTCVYCWR